MTGRTEIPVRAMTPVPLGRTIAGLLTGLAGLIVLGCAGAVLAQSLTPALAMTGLDADVTGYLIANRHPWATAASHAVTVMGDLLVVLGVVLIVGVTAGRRWGAWYLLWIPVLAGSGALVISGAVKTFVARSRPSFSEPLIDASGFAFPSGHAIRALVVYGAMAWLIAAVTRRWMVQVLVWACAGALIAAVGFSRIYLGVHWLSDVLAGYLLGAAWLTLLLVCIGPVVDRRRPRQRGTSTAGAANSATVAASASSDVQGVDGNEHADRHGQG